MEKYEVTIVLPAGTTAAKIKSVKEEIEKMVKVGKGSVVSINDWGEKTLAYEIAGNESGVFVHYIVELDPTQVASFDHQFKLNKEVIRHLIVKTDGEGATEEKKEEKKPAKKVKKAKKTK